MQRWAKVLLAILTVALLLVVALMLFGDDDDEVSLNPGESVVVSVSGLESFARDADHQVYWAGERPDTEYELTARTRGGVLIRYLPAGGAGGTEVLTVASYPVQEAAAALERTARSEDRMEIAKSDGGAVVLLDPKSPDNAHLAYPGEGVEIEVFSPNPGEALRLAARDRVEPVP